MYHASSGQNKGIRVGDEFAKKSCIVAYIFHNDDKSELYL